MKILPESVVTLDPSHAPAAPRLNEPLAEAERAQRRGSFLSELSPYLEIARPDHWFKNVFMALGLVLAYFCHPELFQAGTAWIIIWAIATTCVVASSNYVLNEILDAPTDRSHPIKRNRPVPSGKVNVSIAYAEWIVLGM